MTYEPTACERRPQTQEVRQNEKTEKYAAEKEQGKNPQEKKYEEEKGSLPEKEFRVMIVKISKILEIERRKYKKLLTGI